MDVLKKLCLAIGLHFNNGKLEIISMHINDDNDDICTRNTSYYPHAIMFIFLGFSLANVQYSNRTRLLCNSIHLFLVHVMDLPSYSLCAPTATSDKLLLS